MATEQDAQAVGALAQQFAAYLRGLGDRADFQLNAETYLRDGFGPNPAFSGLVADLNGHVDGYLLYHFGYDADLAVRTLHVADLYVHEDRRRSGVGRALMAAAAEVCKRRGGQRLVWTVYTPNRDAFAFYKRLGATLMEEIRLMYLEV